MSNRYTQGDVVRVTCTFSFEILPETFFELKNASTGKKTTVQLSTPAEGLQIIRDDVDLKKCWIDIDTFNRVGAFTYFFYCRGAQCAGAKGAFTVE